MSRLALAVLSGLLFGACFAPLGAWPLAFAVTAPLVPALSGVRGRRALWLGWVAGTVGRLAPEKDQKLLIDALMPKLSAEVQLIIVGDGSERAALTQHARGSRFIHLVGARKDVPRLLAALDVFVLSSRTEGLPLVIPEAMAMGLPVVSTAVGGIPTVIDEGKTGFLVPAGDAAALGAALARLASDRALADTCGRLGRETALARYSRERMVRDYLDLYEQVLST